MNVVGMNISELNLNVILININPKWLFWILVNKAELFLLERIMFIDSSLIIVLIPWTP